MKVIKKEFIVMSEEEIATMGSVRQIVAEILDRAECPAVQDACYDLNKAIDFFMEFVT